jgi:aminoglycoside phosphotransferase (APT) family kinase protein
MSIERVNPAPTGTVIEGRIERGTIRTNAVVEIVGINPISRTTVTRIEIRDTEVSQAAAGEQVRIHVSLLDSKEVAVGAVVAAPGTLRLTLADYLSEVIENPTSRPASTGQIPSRKFDRETEKIATELVDEAIQSGILLRNAIVEPEEMSGGNTAEAVAKVTLRAPFVFKLDRYTQKLASEAKVMRKIGRNEYEPSLPKRFRDAWPTIYAIRDESPYAYLMEYFPKEQGWISLEDRLYPGDAERQLSAADALRFVNAVLDILFEGFGASVNNRNRPNLVEDYSGRIAQRMRDVAAADARFASKEIVVNGRHCRPWEEYLNILRRGWHFLNRITPSFMTVTHGDPNPGNLMLRVSLSEIELKLIDPKDWMTGDYLFDIAKITHFVSVTGPVEKPAQGKPKVQFKEGNPNTLVYEFEKPPWTDLFVEACLDRVGQFAEKHGDPYYKDRYKLGMAANLLGLPAARLKKGKEESALIMYGTGLTWLDKFCAGIPTN